MRMKSAILWVYLLATIMIGFSACSDSDNPDEDNIGVGCEIPVYTEAFGNLTYNANENLFYFTPKACADSAVVWELNSKSYPVVPPEEGLYMILKNNLGDVWLEINKFLAPLHVINEAIYVKRFISKDNSRSVGLTPELDTPPPAWFFEPLSRSSFNLTGRYDAVNVFVHIVLDQSGSRPYYINKDIIEENVITTLNQFYRNNVNLFFVSIGSDYINYLYPNFSFDKNYNELFDLNRVENALNIYIPYKDFDSTYSGVAKGVISNACILQYSCHYTSTAAHEIGHCIGLYHTHAGTAKLWHADYKDLDSSPEYVDGSNGANAGDYIADTPADPNLWDAYGRYAGGISVIDGHGQQYNPDPSNLMSYSGALNRTLSPLQIQRIHQVLEREPMITAMTARQISPTSEELSGQYAGGLHFSERSKILTFPVAADDEAVTWTISQRSSGYNAITQASPTVTTKTGKSITIQHTNAADYYEIYATTITPTGNERRSQVWKATAGIPSAAVGTIKWESGNGTSGSFPGYSPTLTLNSYDTSLDLTYTDLANPNFRSGVTYRLFTAAGGILESSDGKFIISEMDCSRGYLEMQVIDDCCGADALKWQIECKSKWDTFSLDIRDGQLMIDIKPATSQNSSIEKSTAKRNLTIKSINLTAPDGRVLIGQILNRPQTKLALPISNIPKGQYQVEIIDTDGNAHKGHFGI